MRLGNEFNENSIKIECYRAAGQLFSKSKNWYKYCQSELACAKLLNESERVEEAVESSRNILRGSFYLEDHQEIGDYLPDVLKFKFEIDLIYISLCLLRIVNAICQWSNE